jgi:hypothetical protein
MSFQDETVAARIAREKRERADAATAAESAKVAAAADPVAKQKAEEAAAAATKDVSAKAEIKNSMTNRQASAEEVAEHERVKAAEALGRVKTAGLTTGPVADQEKRSSADILDKDKGTHETNKADTSPPKPKVDVEPTLVADGSKSPHDVTSEGGNRQEAAHKQEKERLGIVEEPVKAELEAKGKE